MHKTISFSKSVSIFFILQIAFLAGSAAANYPGYYNERRAMRSMRILHGAQMTYSATSGNGNFGSLSALYQASLISQALATGNMDGYLFAVSITPRTQTSPAEFTITAVPRFYGKTGRRSFFMETIGELRGADKHGQPATNADPIIDDCTNGGIADNERCIMESLRHLHGAEMTYAATTSNRNYGGLAELRNALLIGEALSTGRLRGYSISVVTFPRTQTESERFRIIALPQIYGVTGIRSFFIGTDGVMYGADKNGMPADENDPTVDEEQVANSEVNELKPDGF